VLHSFPTRRSSDLLLHRGEIHDEPAVFFEPAFDHEAGAVIVPVESLAAVAGERDEMRRRKDEVLFGDGYFEFAARAHTPVIYSGGVASPVDNRQTSSASHSSRCCA